MKNKFEEIRELTAELVKDTQELSKSILGGVFAQPDGQMEGLSGAESVLAYKEAEVDETEAEEKRLLAECDVMDFTGADGDPDR